MLQSMFIYGFCLLVGLAGLAVSAWVVAAGQLFTMDGLLLAATSLTVGAIFAGNVAWAVHTGEMSELLGKLRSRREESKTPSDTAGPGPA